ncbi:hypothetical protein ACHHYP_16615 [Achlya hypogyna]|uniref:BTB domain-containing protein n=1 Tax=Achlya hypogyna TaxID=1202772 RepID=A0A1V9Y6C7_ACHHY|nr:hypothetical protein ACHHYP_16615 [Achlya hypogyna]
MRAPRPVDMPVDGDNNATSGAKALSPQERCRQSFESRGSSPKIASPEAQQPPLHPSLAETLEKMTALQDSVCMSMKQIHDEDILALTKRLSALISSQRQEKMAFADIMATLSTTASEINSKMHILAHAEAKQAAWDARIERQLQLVGSTVKLNVGGRIFETAKTNLVRHTDSYFAAMLATERWNPRDDGAYFVDADPNVFEYIMAYVRDDEIDFSDLAPGLIYRILTTMDYLGLGIARWQASPFVVLGEDKRSFEITNSTWQVVHARGASPTIRYSVKVLHRAAECARRVPEGARSMHRQRSPAKPPVILRMGFGSIDEPCGWGADVVDVSVGDIVTVIHDKAATTITYLKNGVEAPGWTAPACVVWGPGLLFPVIATNLPALQVMFVS